MASGAMTACGAASATPATRLGAPSIGATSPTSAPRRSNTGPPPPLASTAATMAGRASPPDSEAGLAARRGPAKPSTTTSGPGAPKRGGSPLGPKSPAIIARLVAASVRSTRTGLPSTVGFGQSSALSAVSALPGATTSAVAAGAGLGAGGAEPDPGATAAPVAALSAGVVAGCGNGSKELATASATRSS